MTTFSLKLFAIFAMTLGHAYQIVGVSRMFPQLPMSVSYELGKLMSGTGHMAFPIFAFLIAQGMTKTRSPKRYFARLLLFAVLSEPIYYVTLGLGQYTGGPSLLENLARLRFTNIFFTLALSVAAIMVYRYLKEKLPGRHWLLYTPVALAFLFVAGYANMDYGAYGVLLILGLYPARDRKQRAMVIVFWSFLTYFLGLILTGADFSWAMEVFFLGCTALCADLVLQRTAGSPAEMDLLSVLSRASVCTDAACGSSGVNVHKMGAVPCGTAPFAYSVSFQFILGR